MGRTLPWKQQGTGAGAATSKASATIVNVANTWSPRESPPPSSSPPQAANPRATTAATTAATTSSPHPQVRPTTRTKRDHSHDISDDGFGHSSPARASMPLPEILMIAGLQHDDKWRMVEDEFVAMAHKFTAHLHTAEYQRLKKLARDQNADALRSLSRPVTAPMTDRVKRRRAVLALKESQSTSIKRALSRARDANDDEVDELPWAGTNLGELMDSPRKKAIPLSRMVSTASGTRAAALSRKDSVSSLKDPRQSDSRQQRESTPTTPTKRKSFVRPRQAQSKEEEEEDEDEEEDFEKDPFSWRPTATVNASSSLAASSGRALKALPTVTKSAPAPPMASNTDDDSDGPIDTLFGHHFRQRRKKTRVKSSTLGAAPKKGPVRSSLSIPST